ncbi:IS4 family transposase [Streptomyces sp. NPDC020412]|uniref:IS4 family transposase n=1 Tax=Streptomyces sp. NPDC020412 TaxID=3365073 RepID=UPI00379D08E6
MRPADLVSLGALTTLVPRAVLDEAIGVLGAQEQRVRKLPAHVVVYLLMGLCLYPDDDYERVAEKLAGVMSYGSEGRWQAPTRGAITQARQRLGAAPVREVFARLAQPVATAATPDAFLGRWRMMTVDAFGLHVPDTPANVEEFGGRGPRAHVVAIGERASGAPVAADIVPRPLNGATHALSLYRQLTRTMLVLADQGFYSYDGWRSARASGAELLWSTPPDVCPEHVRDLADGSWHGLIAERGASRRRVEELRTAARAGEGVDPAEASVVRVVDYVLPAAECREVHLVTSLLDPADATAKEAADAWQRWRDENETAPATARPNGSRVLRSRSPELVRQEVWALLLTHWAQSALMCRAVTNAGIGPVPAAFRSSLRLSKRRRHVSKACDGLAKFPG